MNTDALLLIDTTLISDAGGASKMFPGNHKHRIFGLPNTRFTLVSFAVLVFFGSFKLLLLRGESYSLFQCIDQSNGKILAPSPKSSIQYFMYLLIISCFSWILGFRALSRYLP
jgi:hypothetical protein